MLLVMSETGLTHPQHVSVRGPASGQSEVALALTRPCRQVSALLHEDPVGADRAGNEKTSSSFRTKRFPLSPISSTHLLSQDVSLRTILMSPCTNVNSIAANLSRKSVRTALTVHTRGATCACRTAVPRTGEQLLFLEWYENAWLSGAPEMSSEGKSSSTVIRPLVAEEVKMHKEDTDSCMPGFMPAAADDR